MGLVAGLVAGIVALLWAVAAVAWASPTPPPKLAAVVLPRDHASHPGFQVEWWYTAGRLTDAHGDQYFWFATAWSGGPGLVARVNVVDLRQNRIVLADQYIRPVPLSEPTTLVDVGSYAMSWRPAGRRGIWSVNAPTPTGALVLTLTPRAPYMLNGKRGIIHQGPELSDYYSEPRLLAQGTLTVAGKHLHVHGLGWLDHQWGNFESSSAAVHWNWFACQLNDGRNLMLYQFIDGQAEPTGIQAGTLMTRNGTVRHLERFTISGRSPFVHPTGAQASYPLRWRLGVPAARLNLAVRSLASNQFITMTFVPSFWEGAAAITRGPAGNCIVESTREPIVPIARQRSSAALAARSRRLLITRRDQDADRDREVGVVTREVVIDGIDVAAREVADARPHRHPQCRSDGVEDQEAPPVHAADTGDDAVGLAQALDEACDDDDLAAVSIEEAGCLVDALRGEEYIAPVAVDEPAAAKVTDGKAGVVAQHGGEEPDQPDEVDR
jgi:predicted secreted hydrolase